MRRSWRDDGIVDETVCFQRVDELVVLRHLFSGFVDELNAAWPEQCDADDDERVASNDVQYLVKQSMVTGEYSPILDSQEIERKEGRAVTSDSPGNPRIIPPYRLTKSTSIPT